MEDTLDSGSVCHPPVRPLKYTVLPRTTKSSWIGMPSSVTCTEPWELPFFSSLASTLLTLTLGSPLVRSVKLRLETLRRRFAAWCSSCPPGGFLSEPRPPPPSQPAVARTNASTTGSRRASLAREDDM